MRRRALVGVLLPGLCLAVAAQAGIKNSVHDFSSLASTGGQLCIACHTPHKADVTVPDAPLWNHTLTQAVYTLYDSPTFEGRGSISQPAGVSKLCLSCHDGTVAIDSFGGTTGSGEMIAKRGNVAGKATLSLKVTHPVSFSYDAALAASDGELADPASLPKGWVVNGRFECSSCHDVHNNKGTNRLLNTQNGSSKLCLKCHIK